MKYKLACVVVLYNPLEDILENITSYIENISLCIVIDNSVDCNNHITTQLQKKLQNMIYVHNNDNIGIASALNIGCKIALDHKCDWILTMDQDSRFINFKHYLHCLEHLKSVDNVALLVANTLRDAQKYLPLHPTCNFEEKFMEITSGNFLNLALFNSIGRFEEKLFIDMVDYDFCLKINSLHYKILYFKDVLLEHNVGELKERKNILTRKIHKKIEHNPQRTYYKTRNYLYISKKYSNAFHSKVNIFKAINILFIHEIIKILLYEDQKYQKIRAKWIALSHFILNKYGKYTL